MKTYADLQNLGFFCILKEKKKKKRKGARQSSRTTAFFAMTIQTK